MTHGDLVKRAGRWLRNTLHCGVVFEEMVSIIPEIPDAIGWVGGKSIVVECKTSTSDFRAGLKKWHRSHGSEAALGMWRFYLSPPGVIPHTEVPGGWGLYEVHGRSVVFVAGTKYANAKRTPFASNISQERTMMLTALRKAQINNKMRSHHD